MRGFPSLVLQKLTVSSKAVFTPIPHSGYPRALQANMKSSLWAIPIIIGSLASGAVVKNPPANVGDIRDSGSILGREVPLEEEMAIIPVFLPGKSHGQRSLAGYSPWGHKIQTQQQQIITGGVSDLSQLKFTFHLPQVPCMYAFTEYFLSTTSDEYLPDGYIWVDYWTSSTQHSPPFSWKQLYSLE